MSSSEILEILRATGALTHGHFELSPGVHTDALLMPVKATQFAPYNRRLCHELVRHFLELDIHVVVAVSLAAIPVAVEMARQLESRCVFVVWGDCRPALFAGFELHDGERAVVVENLLESDEAIDPVANLLRQTNTRLIGVASIIDARPTRKRFTVKDVAAIQYAPARHAREACPLCATGVPLASADVPSDANQP